MEIALLILAVVLAINFLTVAGGAVRGRRRDQALTRYYAEIDRYRSARGRRHLV